MKSLTILISKLYLFAFSYSNEMIESECFIRKRGVCDLQVWRLALVWHWHRLGSGEVLMADGSVEEGVVQMVFWQSLLPSQRAFPHEGSTTSQHPPSRTKLPAHAHLNHRMDHLKVAISCLFP